MVGIPSRGLGDFNTGHVQLLLEPGGMLHKFSELKFGHDLKLVSLSRGGKSATRSKKITKYLVLIRLKVVRRMIKTLQYSMNIGTVSDLLRIDMREEDQA